MYTEQEAFHAMRLYVGRRLSLVLDALGGATGAITDPDAVTDWRECLMEALHPVLPDLPVEADAAGDVVTEAWFVASEHEASQPPECPVCKQDLDSPHVACRETVVQWMKLLR
ncbi:MAG: hypothetical protein ACYDCT_09170 [Dehalococcoidia bacterium]